MNRGLHFRHILSDKTGTITENNLCVEKLCTPETVIPLDSNTHPVFPSVESLLLNMITNHSALTVSNPSIQDSHAFLDCISFGQSHSFSRFEFSRSFSEIRICSFDDELKMQETALLQPHNKEQGTQVFCSSQDERVFDIGFDYL